MTKITYTINDPRTGNCEDFTNKALAVREAKRKDYTPVFIDVYDNEAQDIITDIRVDILNVTVIN